MAALERNDQIQIPFKLLLRTLHDWSSTLSKPLGSCLSIATSPEASEIIKDLHEALRQDPPTDEPTAPSFLRRRRQSLPGFYVEPDEEPPSNDGPPSAASASTASDSIPGGAPGEQLDPTSRDTAGTPPLLSLALRNPMPPAPSSPIPSRSSPTA